MATMTFTGELTIVTCWCGIKHAVPSGLRAYQVAEHEAGRTYSIHCPLGHEHVMRGETKAAKLERELEWERRRVASERQQHDQTKAELRETELRRRAEKGQKTRLKHRIENGLCPCCNRHFANVAQHIHQEHPAFLQEAE